MITLDKICLSRGNKQLLSAADCQLFSNEKIGLIGRNGCGKSSLFSLLLGKLEVSAGNVNLPKQLNMAHLAQETPSSKQSAIDYVLDGNQQFRQLESALTATKDLDKLGQLQTQFEAIDGYRQHANACKLLHGLGFEADNFKNALKDFSGGWRMRLNLARCLMTQAKLLLLDEPTNHLDIDAILFLERYLKRYEGTLIIISHDKSFLNSICQTIIHVEHKKLNRYAGNYDQFEKLRAEKILLQQKLAEKQQKHIDHMMKFVNRFKAKSSKAKQAQSRLKAIEKMELVAVAHADSTVQFEFKPCHPCQSPVIDISEANIGYEQNAPLISHINISLQYGERIALLGPNGIGKSTFLKVLAQKCAPLSGKITFASHHLKLAYYEQHQLEQLDVNLTPLMTLQQQYPQETEQSLRNYLGQFGFHGQTVNDKIGPLSGGEKARLVLALLIFSAPNMLLLDEPTNHLDLDMRIALEMALQSFEGTLIIISHDRNLLATTVDTFYVLKDKKLSLLVGGIEEYEQLKAPKHTAQAEQKTKVKSDKKRQNRIKKIEGQIEHVGQKLEEVEAKLALDTTYEDQALLQKLLDSREQLQQELKKLESSWFELQPED